MPILDVQLVGTPSGGVTREFSQRIADAAADVFGAAPHTTWVRVRILDRDAYAENGGMPEEMAPVFVSVLHAARLSTGARTEEAARLSAAIARVCGRAASDVHILFEPPAGGRIAFGGTLQT